MYLLIRLLASSLTRSLGLHNNILRSVSFSLPYWPCVFVYKWFVCVMFFYHNENVISLHLCRFIWLPFEHEGKKTTNRCSKKMKMSFECWPFFKWNETGALSHFTAHIISCKMYNAVSEVIVWTLFLMIYNWKHCLSCYQSYQNSGLISLNYYWI